MAMKEQDAAVLPILPRGEQRVTAAAPSSSSTWLPWLGSASALVYYAHATLLVLDPLASLTYATHG